MPDFLLESKYSMPSYILVSPVVASAGMLFLPRPTLLTANTPNSYSVYGLGN